MNGLTESVVIYEGGEARVEVRVERERGATVARNATTAADGNKRIGSLLFVDFLNRNGRLFRGGEPVINDVGLAALALLVAESDARNKDVMIRLVMNMLAGGQS